MHIQVPTNIVRNEDVFISNDEFMLYARLCYLHFKNYQNDEIQIDHRILMSNLLIVDSRTLKNRLNKLHKANLILNKIDKIPRKGKLVILFNSKIQEESKHFTMMDDCIFEYVENNLINSHAFRLVFYYKSHINKSLNERSDGSKNMDYCFVGTDMLKHRLKMGGHTIKLANDELVKNKLIKVEKHKLKDKGEYNEKDELIFDRYNNHYIVADKLFPEKVQT